MSQDRPGLRYTWEVTSALMTFSTLQRTFLLTPLSFPISFTLFPPDFMCKDQEGFHDGNDYILERWGKSQCRYECLLISSPVKHHVTDPYLFICLFIYLNSADYDPYGGTRCQRTKSLSSMTREGILKVWESFGLWTNRKQSATFLQFFQVNDTIYVDGKFVFNLTVLSSEF